MWPKNVTTQSFEKAAPVLSPITWNSGYHLEITETFIFWHFSSTAQTAQTLSCGTSTQLFYGRLSRVFLTQPKFDNHLFDRQARPKKGMHLICPIWGATFPARHQKRHWHAVTNQLVPNSCLNRAFIHILQSLPSNTFVL